MADTVPFGSHNADMRAAVEKAQQQLPEFRRALEEDFRRMIPVISRALVKARFRTRKAKATEHLWLEEIEFSGDNIVGTVANEPDDVPDVKLGTSVTIAPADVSDWIYWIGEQTFGGFTVDLVSRHETDSHE